MVTRSGTRASPRTSKSHLLPALTRFHPPGSATSRIRTSPEMPNSGGQFRNWRGCTCRLPNRHDLHIHYVLKVLHRFVVVGIGVLMVGSVGCLPGSDPGPQPPKQARPARLVLGSVGADQRGLLLRPVDPDTLADVPSLEPLELPSCSSSLKVQPAGNLAVAVTGAFVDPQRCPDAAGAALRVLDLNAWTWKPDIALPATSDGPLLLDGGARTSPLAWSADGRSVYALTTTTPSEQRRLWLIDASGG